MLLDAGMATHLSGDDQQNMVGLFEAFSELDGANVADWVLRFSGGWVPWLAYCPFVFGLCQLIGGNVAADWV